MSTQPAENGQKVCRTRVRQDNDLTYAIKVDVTRTMGLVKAPENTVDQSNSEVERLSFISEPPANADHDLKNVNDLPDKLIMMVLSYVPHIELAKTVALVCKKWRALSYSGLLWRTISLRPEFCNFYIKVETLVALIGLRFANHLRCIDLPCELITVSVIHELAAKCPAVKRITLDFSKATQLNDFTDLTCFPSNLHSLCLCLSEVVFLEGFMRRIYNFLSSLKVLHLIGTLETSSGDEEIFEVVNLGKIRAHTPNLRIVNLYGVTFVDDSHLDMIASSCIHLEVIAVNYCLRVNGSSLKHLTSRCKKLKTLLLRHTNLKDEYITAVDWAKCSHMEELDISCTDLSEATLLDLFSRLPPLTFLAVAHCDFFSDKVLSAMFVSNKLQKIASLDLSFTYSLNDAPIIKVINAFGNQLIGLMLSGKPKLAEHFWCAAIPLIPNIRILTLGTAYGWFIGSLSRVHLDQIINIIAHQCHKLLRLEIQWEPDTIRYSDKSSKFIDLLRIRCGFLQSVTLADGGYYEMVRSNFERADRPRVVRPTNQYQTSILSQLHSFNELLFN